MAGPYIHSKTLEQLRSVWKSSAHGILIAGPKGIGLSDIATYVSADDGKFATWVRPQKDEAIDYEKGSITVSQVRELYDTLKTRSEAGRVVVIDAAEKMAEPAQNAFLKLLEEPPVGVRFVLLSHSPQLLLPTIRSRVQKVDALPLSRGQSEVLLDELGVDDPMKRTQLLFIARGLPGELRLLAGDDEAFMRRAEIVRDARTFLQGTQYERLKLAHSYKDSKEKALLLIGDALKQLRQSAAKTGDTSAILRMNRLQDAYGSIRQNGNIRLQLAATLVL